MSDYEIRKLRKDIYIIYAILFVLSITSYIMSLRLQDLRKTGIVVEPKVEVEILEKK